MDVSPTIHSLHGRIFIHTGADPAAGAEVSITVPDRRRWKLQSLLFSLVTDVNAADRTILLRIIGSGITVYQISTSTVQTASLTRYYVWTESAQPELVIANAYVMHLPRLIIPAGYIISTLTTNIQVGDNYSAPRFLVEEWIDP